MHDANAGFYATFAARFTEWAGRTDDIEAAYLIGSRAREDHPADEWSDMDILLYTTNPSHYLEQSAWLDALGDVLISFFTYTAGGDPERLTLFDGGYQVDFVIAHTDALRELARAGAVHGNFHRGVRVLVDKIAIGPQILPKAFHAPAVRPIDAPAFAQTCQMFWFAVQYVAKQILRDELWVAKARDADIKAFLLQMIEWHEVAAHGAGYDTWHAGRFIKEWAADVYPDITQTFGRFTQRDSWDALQATIALFERLSHAVAEQYGYGVPQAEGFVKLWLRSNGERIAGVL